MDLFLWTRAAGFGLGATLHAALLGLVLRRTARRPGEGLLGLVALALVVWNLANLCESLLDVLWPEPVLARALRLAGVGAALFVPGLVTHLLLVIRDRHAERPLLAQPWARGAFLYAPPTGVGVAALAGAPQGGIGVWFAGALGLAALLALDLGRQARARADAHEGTPRFYRFLAGILLGSAALAGAIGFDIVRRGPGAPLVEIGLLVLSLAPSAALAYGVHRYYAIDPLLRRRAIDWALGLCVLAALVELSAWLLPLAAARGLRAPVVQAGLVLAAAAALPLRRLVLRGLAAFVDPARANEARLLGALADALAQPGASTPSELAARVAKGVADVLALEAAGMAVVPARPGGPVAAAPPALLPWRALLDALAELPPRSSFRRAEMPSVELSRALAEARIDQVRPLRYEGDLVGALAIGLHRDGSAPQAEALAALERVGGALAAAAGSVRLVDRALALEGRVREEERLASLGRLAATVAHRVKNPLASIKAICQTLVEDLAADDPRREDLGIVIGEVDTLAHVVTDLLGFARKPRATVGPVDVERAVHEAVDLLRHQAEGLGVGLELWVGGERAGREERVGERERLGAGAKGDGAAVEAAGALEAVPAQVSASSGSGASSEAPAAPVAPGARARAMVPQAEAEPQGLREALLNLIENALQHAPRGSQVRVAVDGVPARANAVAAGATSAATAATPGAAAVGGAGANAPGRASTGAAAQTAVEVVVEDDGPGVPPAARERLFEPFFTTRPEGTGLGLFVSKRNVESVGGSLELDPGYANGARFVLRLPAAEVDAAAEAPAETDLDGRRSGALPPWPATSDRR